jgi:hypothetical protein
MLFPDARIAARPRHPNTAAMKAGGISEVPFYPRILVPAN